LARHYYFSAGLALIFQLLLLNFLLLLLEPDRPIETAVLNAVAVGMGALLNYLFASLWVFRR
jgi:putative flippase GtrA